MRKTMQKFASEMMSYLAKRGSRLKLLAFASRMQPDFDEDLPPDSDSNGHWWPNYYYLRDREIDTEGREHTVAMPVQNPSLEIRDLV
jgi:hypothetical protein